MNGTKYNQTKKKNVYYLTCTSKSTKKEHHIKVFPCLNNYLFFINYGKNMIFIRMGSCYYSP